MERFAYYTTIIERELRENPLSGEPSNLYDPINYILQLGGKRLRAALTLAACELYGAKAEDALSPALAIEIFHNFSLVHDDIMDAAPLRRGSPSVHKKWNTNTAILSGDAMLVKAYQKIAEVNPNVLKAVLDTFSQTAIELCEGQQYDLNFEDDLQVKEEDYIHMIRLKTSVLIGCALKIGALIGRAPHDQLQFLYDFGVNIGLAFQIQDDILDTFGESGKVGKQDGGDIISDKKTLMMIYALKHQPQVKHWIGVKDKNAEKIKAVRKIFTDCGALEYAEKRKSYFYRLAIENLEMVSGDPKIKNQLRAFAAYLTNREN